MKHSREHLKKYPPKGAIETFKYLDAREDCEVVICSSPITNYKNCVTEKYQWVEKHLGKDKIGQVMLTKDKTIVHVSLSFRFGRRDNPTITRVNFPTDFETLTLVKTGSILGEIQ